MLAHGGSNSATEKDVLSQHKVMGQKFELFAYTIQHSSHFYAVIRFAGKKFIYDGARSEKLHAFVPVPPRSKLSTVWCIRSE